jgi:ribonuclease HI
MHCLAEPPKATAGPSSHLEILQQVFHFHEALNYVVVCWVPDHTGLRGKEAADAAAKQSTLLGNLASDCAMGSDV